jgi:tyrosyl-tRNA synthetase
MTDGPMNLLEDLRWRGLVSQVTDDKGLEDLLGSGPQTVYIGFDPTADSLHVGSMMQLMMLRRFQKAGHRPIALVGGATGMIGDPSGKSEERNLLSVDQLEKNVQGVAAQMRRFLDFDGPSAARILNNFDWMQGFSYLQFLRDIGKNFPIGVMLGKESVRSRLDSEAGLSYTEFSYMLLQAYDFVYLAQNHGCRIQAGGSDQWGNITAGIDLGRRMTGTPLFGLTAPLLTTSDGRKMGKTEQGAVWLSDQRTSPYNFYQYWIGVKDEDVLRCIRYLTEIDRQEYQQIEQELQENPGGCRAQKRLAEALTILVHGEDGLRRVVKATEILFGGEIDSLDDAQLTEIFADVPSRELPRQRLAGDGLTVIDALVQSGLTSSNGEARRTIKEGGAYVNNRRVGEIDQTLTDRDLASQSILVLRRGKKKYALLRFV